VQLLVTGGAGYVGSVVTGHLLEAGHRVTVLDDLSTGHADAVPEGANLVQAGVAEADSVLDRGGYDAVLHFAARSLVAESMAHPETYWRNNVGGTMLLLDAMRRAAVPRIVFSSTAAVYGEPDAVPIVEYAPTRPGNPYGASKLAIDHMLAGEAAGHGLAAVSLRYFNVAGAWRGLGERHATETHLIPIALQVAAGQRDVLEIFGDDYPTPDGTCVRDYVHVADLARAHLMALDAARPDRAMIYNLGNGQGFSVLQVVDAVRSVTGHPVPVAVRDRRPGDPATLVASSELIRAELGWAPERSRLEDMIADAWACGTRTG
jgi:UDP-glucose 4-epimerase